MSTTHLDRNSVAPEVLASRLYKLKGQAQVIVHVIPSNGSLPTNDHVLVRVAYAPLSGRGSRKNVGDEIVTTWGRLLPTIAPRAAAKGEGDAVTIPPNLEAFRALMVAAAGECELNGYPANLIVPDLRALATATPAQLCGIAGEVECFDMTLELTADAGDILVTPRDAT